MSNNILKQWLNPCSFCVSCKSHSPQSFTFKDFSSLFDFCWYAVEIKKPWSHCWLGIWGFPLQLLTKSFFKSTNGFSFCLLCWNLVTWSLLGTIEPKIPVYSRGSTCHVWFRAIAFYHPGTCYHMKTSPSSTHEGSGSKEKGKIDITQTTVSTSQWLQIAHCEKKLSVKTHRKEEKKWKAVCCQ